MYVQLNCLYKINVIYAVNFLNWRLRDICIHGGSHESPLDGGQMGPRIAYTSVVWNIENLENLVVNR